MKSFSLKLSFKTGSSSTDSTGVWKFSTILGVTYKFLVSEGWY